MADKPEGWMPLYPADYWRDTGHLTAAEDGAYLQLLMRAWVRDGSLPTDDDQLRRLSKMDPKEWNASRKTILAFFQRDGEVLRHKRIDHELWVASRNIQQKSAAGRASAEARRLQREANSVATALEADAEHITNREPTDGQRLVNPSPSPSPVKEEPSLRSGRDAALEEPKTPTAKDRLWSEGLSFLEQATGKSQQACRGPLGLMIKDAGGDCSIVLAAIEDAKAERPVDPVPWLRRACQRRSSGYETDLDAMAREMGLSSDLDQSLAEALREQEKYLRRKAIQ